MRHRLPLARLVLIGSCLIVGATTAVRLGAAADAPVAAAAMRGDSDEVRTLLRGGADVNAAQGDGMTALHWTALNGDLKTMDVLLYGGAATEALTRVGAYTPLHLASSRGQAAAIARLLEAGAKVGRFTSTGVQPLHLAAQAGNADAVKALLDRGAEVNAKDKTHGRTALIFATAEDRVDVMKVLLARGADTKLATTVIDYPARAASDTQARTARDKVVSAQTGRTINSNFDPDPPPPGTVNPPGSAVGGGRAAADPADPSVTGRAGRGAGPRAPSDVDNIGKQGGIPAMDSAARAGIADE